MIIGYQITAQDDDSNMLGIDTFKPLEKSIFYDWRFGKINEPHPATCTQCGRKIVTDYINENFKVKRRKKDIVYTYDGYLLVSKKLKEKLVNQTNNSYDFVNLPNDSEFFWLNPKSIIDFDAEKRKTRFENFCDKCNSYHDVVGARPIYLKNSKQIEDSKIYKTNIEFGSGHGQHPLIIIGNTIHDLLEDARMNGIEYNKIEE